MSKEPQNGKGSRRRNSRVSRKEFEKNWNAIFDRKKPYEKYKGKPEHDQRGWQPK